MAKVRLFWMGLGSLRIAIIMVALLAFVAMFYEPACAIINYIAGPPVPPGYGHYYRGDSLHVNVLQIATDSSMGIWDIDQTINGEKTFSGDSLIVSAGGLRTLNINCYGDLTVNAGGTVTLPDDQIGDAEIDWGSGAGQVDTDDIPEGTNKFDQALPDSGDWSTAYSWGDHSTQNYLDDDVTGDVDSDDIADQTIVKADIDTTSTFVFGAAHHITSAEPESMFMSKTYIDAVSGGDASKADISDSLWTFDQFWGGAELAVRTGVVDEIGIQYPLANDSNGYFVRHTHIGVTADEADTVVFGGYLPMGMDETGVDSVVYNMKTSYPADSVYVQVKVFKRDWGIGTLTFCDSVAAVATAGGAWEHKTTGALATAANAGEFLEIWFIVTFPSETINVVLADHDKPKVWYTGR